jgi:hypothetical protein
MITGLTQFKKLNICGAGNKPNTRMRTLHNRLQRWIQRAANCYQATWNTLYQLEPDGGTWKDRYLALDIKNIRGPGKQIDDPIPMTNGRFEQSWIWMVGHSNGMENNEEEFDKIMLAEWAKMRAHRDRWEEKYMLVVEEMRCTVAYLKWKVKWHGQAHRQTQLDFVTSQGLNAYAEHQAKTLELLVESCIQKWLPALSSVGIVVDWGLSEMTDISPKTVEDRDQDEEWFNDDDDEIDDDPFDRYELDD